VHKFDCKIVHFDKMGILCSYQSRGPERVPTDEIVSLRIWDTALCMRSTVLDISLKIDDFLDITKIRGALDELFELEDWKQLGARLRMNVSYANSIPAGFPLRY
jgi:hypothetical protein